MLANPGIRSWANVALIAFVFAVPVNIFGQRYFNELALPAAVALFVPLLAIHPRLTYRDLQVLLVGILFIVLFSVVAALHLPSRPAVKDLIEVLKPGIYAAFVVLGMRLAREVSDAEIGRWVLRVALVSVGLSSFVFVPALHPLADVFKGRPSTDLWNFHFTRFSGTLAYPDVFACWLLFALLLLFCGIGRSWYSRTETALGLVLLPTGMVLSGSRAGLLLALLCVPFALGVLWLIDRDRRIELSALGIGGVAVGLVALLAGDALSPLQYLRQGAAEGLLDGSFAHRVRELTILADLIGQGRLLGNGPDNAFLSAEWGPVESGYFYYLYKFGLAGAAFLLAVGAVALRAATLSLARERGGLRFVVGVWVLASVFIGGISLGITEEYKSFALFFIVLGILAEVGPSQPSRSLKTQASLASIG